MSISWRDKFFNNSLYITFVWYISHVLFLKNILQFYFLFA